MSRHQRVIIELSLRILRGAMIRSGEAPVDGIEVRLALRCLLPHCRDRWPLDLFWDAAKGDNAIGHAQGCTAAFNGIFRQLRLSGTSPSEEALHQNEVRHGTLPHPRCVWPGSSLPRNRP